VGLNSRVVLNSRCNTCYMLHEHDDVHDSQRIKISLSFNLDSAGGSPRLSGTHKPVAMCREKLLE